MEKITDVGKEKSRNYQKYKKYLSKAIMGAIIGAIGLAIPLSLLNLLEDNLWAIGCGIKLFLTGYGLVKTVVNGSKATSARVNFEESNAEYELAVNDMERELSNEKEKSKDAEKSLSKVKSDYEKLRSEVISTTIPQNTKLDTKGKELVKTKKK